MIVILSPPSTESQNDQFKWDVSKLKSKKHVKSDTMLYFIIMWHMSRAWIEHK